MEIPDWIKESEKYQPIRHRKSYLIKNLFKVLSFLDVLKNQDTHVNTNDVAPHLKILSLFLIVFCIVLSHDILSLWICSLFVLIQLSFNQGKIICNVLKKATIIFVFPFIVFLPYAILVSLSVAIMYYIKIFVILICVQNFIIKTTCYDALKALKQLHCPNMLLFIMDIMVKYLFVISYILCDILQAIILRSLGKDMHVYKTIGGIFANVFLKVKNCGEELYEAMECRGFCEGYITPISNQRCKKDIIFLIENIVFFIVYFCIRSC